MIVGKLTCGFGNQLFQYACAYAVSRELGATLVIDCLSYDKHYDRALEIDKLSVSAKLLKSNLPKCIRGVQRLMYLACTKYCKEATAHVYEPKVFLMGTHVYLCGYWQSDKYFRKYKKEIQKEFSPKAITEKMRFYGQKYRDMETCAVHIRRGDYVQLNDCINMDFYVQAMEVMKRQKGDCHFVFFSDDIDWVKKYFADFENIEFFDQKDAVTDLEEFFIMSSCKNQIIANSSFSWWAAYLNPNEYKMVIAPEGAKWSGDFYPEEWLKIKAKTIV